MQLIKKKEKLGNILFLIAILLELLIMMTDHSAITLPLRGRVAQLAFVLFGCKILTTDYSKIQWIFIILIGIIGSISYFTCGDEYVLRAALMVIAAKDIDLNKTGKIILWGTLAGTIVIMLLSLFGILGNAVDIRDFGRGMEESRWCLGFSHANNVHDIFWFITALYLLIYQKKCNWKHYVILTLMNLVLFYFTASRNGVLVAQMMIIGCALLHYFPVWNKRVLFYILTILGLTASMFFTVLAGLRGIERSRFVYYCDRLLTGRMEMVWEYAPVSGWELFPGPRSILHVDNGFATLFAGYGIVIGVCFVALIIYMIYYMYKKQNGIAVVFLATVIFVTFMESTFIFNVSLLCNPLYFLLFNEWYHAGKVKRCENESI